MEAMRREIGPLRVLSLVHNIVGFDFRRPRGWDRRGDEMTLGRTDLRPAQKAPHANAGDRHDPGARKRLGTTLSFRHSEGCRY